MRNVLFIFAAMLVFSLSSCNNDEQQGMGNPYGSETEKPHFHGVKQAPETKGVAQRDKMWANGTVITVKLLEDPFNLQQEIISYAQEWEQYANISFRFVGADENALVRIGFNWNDERYVTWSYTGTDCKYVRDQAEATANFADFDLLSAAERRCAGLRLFGQVLGLELEHRHITANPEWRSLTRVEDYWTGNISDIPWNALTQYVFDPISAYNYESTENYDPYSIMVWPFPLSVLRYINGEVNTGRGNCELSETDKAFIARLYPDGEGGGDDGDDEDDNITEIRPIRQRCVQCYMLNSGFEQFGPDSQVEAVAWTWGSVSGEVRQILSFDLSQIKSTSKVDKITLKLFSHRSMTIYHNRANNGTNNAFYVQQISAPWELETLTWRFLSSVRTDNRIRIPHTNEAALDLEIDVTDMAKNMIDNNCNYGFLLQLENPVIYTSRVFYTSNEDISDPAKVPILNITYKQ